MKASSRWRAEFGRALKNLHRLGVLTEGLGVYLGARPMRDGPGRILPLHTFARELAEGRVLRAR